MILMFPSYDLNMLRGMFLLHLDGLLCPFLTNDGQGMFKYINVNRKISRLFAINI